MLCLQAFGFFVGAPATHYWHQFLEKLFPRSKKDDLAPLKKVCGKASCFAETNLLDMFKTLIAFAGAPGSGHLRATLQPRCPDIHFISRRWCAAFWQSTSMHSITNEGARVYSGV